MTEPTDPVPTSPGVSHDFDFLYGAWAVRHTYLAKRLVGCTEVHDFTGTATCRPILAGLGNIDEIRMPSRGVIGSTVRLFDLESRTWSLHWSSTATGRFEPPVVGTFAAGRGIFEGRDTYQSRKILVRYVWDNIGPARARWRQSYSTDDGASWELNWTMDFSRAAGPQPDGSLHSTS